MRLTIFLCLVGSAAFSQSVSIGIKGGVPITDALNAVQTSSASYFTNPKRYLLGGTVELHLPLRLSLEVDAIYKRLGYDFASTAPGLSTQSTTTANSWEFPVLAKFEITPGPIRPFVDAGVGIRRLTGIHQDLVQLVSILPLRPSTISSTSNPVELNKDTDLGLVFGGGIAFKMGRVRISPELRYTRWGGENLRDPIRALLHTNRNQGDFMLGITF